MPLPPQRARSESSLPKSILSLPGRSIYVCCPALGRSTEGSVEAGIRV
jgi:hypothetical protein